MEKTNEKENQSTDLNKASLWKPKQESKNEAAIEALLHTLQFAGVEFLRFGFTDISNSIRVKA